MAQTIVDVARALRAHLPEVVGIATPEWEERLDQLLERDDSPGLRSALRALLTSSPEIVDWISQYVEQEHQYQVESVSGTEPLLADAPASDAPTISFAVSTTLSGRGFRGLAADLEESGVQLVVGPARRSSVRGSEWGVIVVQLSPALVTILEGTAGNAVWGLVRASCARFLRKGPFSGGDAQRLRLTLVVERRRGKTHVALEATGDAADVAAMLENVDVSELAASFSSG